MTVVDTARGTASCFRRTTALGFVYSAHLRRKLDLYFPPNPADQPYPPAPAG